MSFSQSVTRFALASIASLSIIACSASMGSASPSASAPPAQSPSPAASAPPSPSAPSSPSVPPSPTPAPTLAPGVLRLLDLSPTPSGILVAGGLIWAEDHATSNKVYAIDPDSGQTVAAIDVRRPCDIAVLGGRLWIADLDAGKLVWVDLATRAIGGEIPGLSGPCGVQAVGSSVWSAVDQGLARVDPETGGASVFELDDGGAFPAAGEPLWAATYRTGNLVRVDPSTGLVTKEVVHPGGGAEGPALAVGFGAVWVGDAAGHVYRLDEASGATQAVITTSEPTRLLATEGGIWLTSYRGGDVQRIDPLTNTVVYSAHLGGEINGIAAGPDGIWVSDTAYGRLYLIDPNATDVAP